METVNVNYAAAQSPCFECELRSQNCHATCEAYRLFDAQRKCYLNQRKKEVEQASAIIEHVRRTAAKKRQRSG